MADIKTNQSKVYNALKGMGFSGIGANEQEFAAKMGNPKNREKVYKALSGKGYKGIGKDQAAFDSLIYEAPAAQQQTTQPTKQTSAWWESDPSFQQDQQQYTQKVYNPAEDTMGAFVGAAIAQSPKQQPQQAGQKPATKQQASQPSTGTYKPTIQERMAFDMNMGVVQNTIDNATRGIDAIESASKKASPFGGGAGLGNKSNLRKGQKTFDAEKGAFVDTYLTSDGREFRNAQQANGVQAELDKNTEIIRFRNTLEEMGIDPDVDYSDKNNINHLLGDAYAERDALQKRLDEDKEGKEEVLSRIMAGGYDPTPNEKIDNRTAYQAALRMIDRRINALETARDNGGFWGGTADVLTDPSSYSFGLTDLQDSHQMQRISEKIEKAKEQGIKPQFTDAEKAFVRNYMLNQQAEQLNKDNWWYNAGQGFGNTLSFMKDFALTGGGFLNVAKAGLKAGGKLGAKAATKALGEAYLTKSLGTKALGKTIEYVGKGAGLAAGAEAGGFLLNNTVQAASNASDIINKQLGTLTVGKDGMLSFDGSKSLGEAVLKSQIERTGENGSELVGLAFDAMPGILGKVIQKTTVGKALKKLTENKFWKGWEKGMNYLGISSVWGEGMEEEYGMARTEILNRLTNGEFAPEGSGLFDLERQIDTWKTVGLTSMVLRVPSMVVGGTATANYYANKYNLNTSDRNMRNVFGDDTRYESVKAMIDGADNQKIAGVLSNLMTNAELTREEKQAMFLYANDLIKLRGFNIGNVVAAANGYQAPPRVASYQIKGDGKSFDELDENGNVIAHHEYETNEEMRAGLYEAQQQRFDNNLNSDIGIMKSRPADQYGALLREYCAEVGVDPVEFEGMLAKPSMERSETEQQLVAPFAQRLHDTVYDSSMLHEDQSQQDGEEIADANSIDLGNGTGDEGAAIMSAWRGADEARKRLFARNEDMAQEVLSREQQGISHQEIVSSLDTFTEEERQIVIDYYNQKARYEGYVNRMAQKIDEEARNSRERHTFKGTINGNADLTNVYTITDGTNEYCLVSGDITTDPATGRITGSNSGLIIGMDLDGSLVQLGDGSGYSVMQPTMSLDQFEEAERTRLQEQVTSVIDPNGTMGQQQAGGEADAMQQPTEQQAGNVGGEAGANTGTGADETPTPEPVAPTTPINPPSPSGEAAGTPAVSIESVTDKDGIKRYEQGIPVDDAIIDIQNDGFDVNEVADASIAEAQQTVDKINQKSTKTRKDLIDRKNAQDIIDYYNNVKARWAEMNAPAESEENVNIQPEQPAVEEKPVSSQSKLTVEEQKQQRIAEAKAKYGELFDDDFTKANDVFELVSMWVGRKRNLAWDDVNGKRGLQKELGWTRKIGGDTKFIETLLAKSGEGMGVDEFVHMVWESPENDVNGEKRWDTEEIKNALLELLSSARSKSDVVDYAVNTRERAARTALEEQRRFEQEMQDSGENLVDVEPVEIDWSDMPFPATMTDEEVANDEFLKHFDENGTYTYTPNDTERELSESGRLVSESESGRIDREDSESGGTDTESQLPVSPSIRGNLSEGGLGASTEEETNTNPQSGDSVDVGQRETAGASEVQTSMGEGDRTKESQGGSESDPDGIASRITENGEPTEEPSDNGTVYKQEYLIDGKHPVTKVDEPNNKGDYTGSYYLYNGKRYGDLNEIVREIDISERHQKEYDEYIKPLLSRTDEELQQMAKKKEDAVNGDLTQLESDLEYSAIKNILLQREINQERKDVKDFIENTIDDEDVTFVDKVTQKELDELNHLIDEYGVDDSEGKIENYVKRLRRKYPVGKKDSTDNPIEAIEKAAQSFREEQKEREDKRQEDKPKYGADNKLVTTDRYEELKKRMKEKLLGQANVGFDPEILSIGTEMAVYHVEAGARKFTDFAQRMIEELGDAIRPYLKAIYNGAREMPGMEELRKEMTSYEGVSALDVQNIAKDEDNSVNVNKQEDNETENVVSSQQKKPAIELEGESAEFADRQQRIDNLTKRIAVALEGVVFRDESRLTFANIKAMAKKEGVDDISDTDLQELVEAEIVNLAREIANKENLTEEKKFQKIVKLYEGQPSLNVRDNDRINKQQYSTPAPMAYLMGRFCREDRDGRSMRGLEPSAGNGMLTIGLPKEKMHVNDIDEMRLSNLAKQGFGEVTSQDGLQPFGEKQYDVVVTNPPFGSVTPKTYDGLYEISALEHQMVINALESMKDDGRAAIIIGGNTEYNTNGTIKGKDRAFLNYLCAHYNVVDVINMDGKSLYSRQGTGYPTRMILINGRKEFNQKDFAPVQSKARAEQVKSYDELFKRVNDDILSDSNKSAGVHDTESGESRRVDDSGNAGSSTQTGVRNVRTEGGGSQSGAGTQSGSGVQRSDSTPTGNTPQGRRGVAKSEGNPSMGGGLFDFGGGTETSQPSGTTTQQTEGQRNESGRNDTERPSATTDNSQRVGQPGTGTAQQPEQPAVKRGLGTEKVPYRKQSGNPFTLQSLMPAEQADVVKKALEDLGDVDQYLVDELGYSSKEELHQALAAEQIDSVAMAIHQMNQGNAFIIGDQTGIGKGRQAAALIRYGVKKGSFPVFITVKKALFSDMYRDLCDIGSPGLRPFIWSAGDTEKSANVTDKDGNVVYERPNDKEQKRVVDYINKYGKLPPEYDYVLTTYDSFKSGTMDYENGQKKARSFGKKQPSAVHYNGQAKRDALETLAGNSFVIMDESHNAGGEGSNVSNYLQYITTKAKGLTFLSATFAKRPGNMPIYSLKTAIAKAGVKVDELIDAVKRGGATFQEIMSKALTEAGQMIRRERNMEGVTIDWRGIEDEDIIQKQREQYDTIIGLFNDIIDFQRTYVDPIVNKMNDDAAEVQGEVDHTPGTRDMGINNTPFASRTYNMVQQVLLSLKAEEAAKRAIEHLKQGRKPVITVANTNEGAADEASTGEDMEMPDLSINLKKGLQGTLRITKKDAFGNSVATMIPFERISEEGRKRYAEIMDAIENASSGLSLSPIDVIKNELKKAGYKVGELTGRKAEFVYNEDGTAKRVKRQDTDKKKVAADFNNGNLDALILNRSAGTGISLHASSKFKDQRQRIMIVAQAQGDVNDEVQIRGRIDRTGQVLRGMYEYVVSQIPSEQRLLMMLKAKLRSLDANTTSSQKSKFNEMQVQDIINKYGDDIVIQYLSEHPNLAMKMCDPLKWGEGAETLSAETLVSQAQKAQGDGATASKILGRMALLTVKEQEKMLAEIGDLYQAEIDRLNEMGENDLEITEMPLRAKTLKKDVWEEGVEPGGKNPFADNSYVEEVEMDVLRKPMKAEEVKKSQARLLGGKTWEEYKQDVLNKVNDWAENKKKETTKTFTERAEKKATAEKEKYAKGAKKAQEKNGMTDEEIDRNAGYQYDTFYNQEMEKLQNALDAIDKQKQAFVDALDTFTTDGVYALPTDIYDLGQLTFEPSFGKVIDIKISDNFSTTASTISFATLDGRRKITIPISGMVKQNNGEKRDIKPVIVQQTAQTRNGMFGSNVANTLKVLEQNVDNWDKLTSTATRKKGYIITGNLLKALTSLRSQGKGGKLISYTTDTGEIRQGILMGDNFDPGALTSKNPISSAKADLDDWGTNRKITSADGDVTIKADGYGNWMSYTLKVPKSKKKGEKYFNDKTLLSLMDGQFEGSSNMTADFKAENLDAVLKRLDELGVTVESKKEESDNTGRRFDEDIESEENINNNSEGESSKDLFLSLQQKQGDEYNETVNEIGERVYSGRASLYGQGEKSWRGKTSRVAAVAEVISAEHAKNTGASSVHEAPFGDQVVGTERKIEEWSKADGCWLNEEEIAKNSLGGKPISVRSQSKVYLSKDGKTAIKLTYPYARNAYGMLAFLRNISIFNKLFPETAYTITGFTRDEKGNFRVVMEQPYIVGKQYSKEEYEQNGIKDKVEKYFYNLGLYPYYNNFSNQVFDVSDIYNENVILDEFGNVNIIDADVSLEPRFLITEYRDKAIEYEDVTERRYDEDTNVKTSKTQEIKRKNRIAKHIDNLVKKLGTKARTTVYHSFDELPADMKKYIREREKQGRKVRGWYENGHIYLYLPHIDSIYQAEKTIWHETVAHHGLRELVGAKNYNQLLKRLWLEHRDGEMGKWVTERMQTNGWSLAEAIDEYLAREAEKNPFKEPGLWQRLRWMVADILHKMGFTSDPTISDIQYLFWVSENQLREGDPMTKIRQQAFLFNLERQASTTPYINMNASRPEDIDDPEAEGAYDDGTRYSEETDNRGFITEGEHKGSTYSSVYGKRRKNSPANSSNYTIGEYKTTGILPGQLTLTEARVKDSKGNVVARLYKTENGYQAETPSMSYMTGVYSTEKKAIDALRRETSGSRRFDEDIDDPLEYSAKQVYNERLNRVETVFTEAYQDSMIALKTAQNAIAGDNDIPDSQNAYMAENLMHGKNKNEMDLFNSMFRDPLIKTINKIMNLTGMNWGDVDRYVYTKSGLERNREFFVRDWLEAERNKNIRKYEDLSQEERDIFDRKAATIETLFEDGDIETEEDKQKELGKALKEAHKEYVDEVERQYQRVKSERFMDLQIGNSPALGMDTFSFVDYLGEIDKFIRDNIDPDYVASEHDYSGFRAMYGDEKGKYNEDAIIEELMDTEDQIEAENVDTLWEQIQNATCYGLERYREAGMRSDEQIDQIEQMFHWYVPMRGFKENMGEDMYQYFTQKGTAKSYIGGLLKHAKGRGSEAQYPISTIFAMTYKAISDCNQNLVNQKLYRLCQANPNDLIILSDSWAVFNEVTGEWEETTPDIPDDADEEEVRQITLAWEDDMRQLASENKAKKIKGRERFDYKPMDKKKQSEHIVDVRINGNPRKMIVTSNPRMAQALNGQLRFERGKNVFSKWNADIKNMMATFFTSYSPTFALRNMFRDWTHFRTMLGVREGHGYAKQANKYYRQSLFKMVGLFKKYRNGKIDESNEMERDFKDFMDNGGITGFVFMQKIDDIQKEMEKLYSQQKQGKTIRLNNKLWEYILGAIEALNEGIENNARFATYRASRHYAGRTRARSAYDAKEITVNFNRKGAGSKTAGFKSQSKSVEDAAKAFGVTSQILGEGRIFFNATVQAIATTFKNFQNSDGSLNKPYIAKWAGKYALPPFMFGLALPLINKALSAALGGDGDDDPYGNLPEWTRRKNLCFYIGNGNFITIPIGQELAAFLTLGDIVAGNTYAPDLKPVDRSWDDEMLGVMNTFSPVDVDTKITKGGLMEDPVDETIGRTFSVLAPLVAVQQNLGWTGRPIYREDRFQNDQYTPEYQMVYSGTNPVLVNASKLLHELGGGDDITRGKMEVNPAIVQYLWEQYTGGPGKVFSNTISIGKDAKDILSGNESDFNIRKVEGLKAFVQQGDDRTQYYRTQAKYRKYSEDAEKLYDAVKGYENGAAENPEYVLKLEQISKGEDFVRMQIVREADKELSKINRAANKAEGKERKELRKIYNERVREVVDLLDKVENE